MTKRLPHQQRVQGFGVIAIMVVLVMLAGMAAAVVRLGWSSQANTSQDLLALRATQAARSGIEWGVYQALRGTWTACSGATQTLDLSADLGMHVTVTCARNTYNEGESSPGVANVVSVYTINAVACTAATCPDNTAAVGPYYAERAMQAVISN
jgi:MSHA biogenesis protein MshP